MTGLYEVDLSVASATGLMNIHEKRWDSEALAVAGISGEQLPLIVPTTRSITLPSGIALYIGASDGALANVGSGAVAPGAVAVTIGTSAAIRTVVPAPVLDDRMRSFCYCLDAERYIAGGASNNGTNVLEWLRNDVFRSPLAAAAFVDSAAEAPPGADGLLFFPWMFGERAPLYDAQARGAYFGLSAAHGQAHFVRAALEGIVFNLRLVGEVLESKAAVRMLYASGGFSHNSLWVSILADIFQKPVVLSGDGADASVWGAVQLGRAASGMPLLPAGASERVVEPNEKNAAIYGEIYGRFRQMALRDTTFAAG